jgi:hypothetical protein
MRKFVVRHYQTLIEETNMGLYNNAREIKASWVAKYKQKPSYGLLQKLECVGYGAGFTTNHGEDTGAPEELYETITVPMADITDEELADLL